MGAEMGEWNGRGNVISEGAQMQFREVFEGNFA